jgi:2'-5' RNA ligase
MSLRCFIALEFSAVTRQQLGTLSQQLAASAPRAVNWVKPELIHLTIKFLGDMPENKTSNIATALDSVAQNIQPFQTVTSGLGCFPNAKRPRVIWIGFQPETVAHLKRLSVQVEAAIVPLGFPTEERPFSPHLTLGRVRKDATPAQAAKAGEGVRALTLVPTLTDSITSITLMKSDLRSGGPIYTPLHVAHLSG